MQLFSWDTGVLPPDDYVVRVGRVTVGGRLVECVETLVLDPLNGSLAVARRSAVGPDQFAAEGDVQSVRAFQAASCAASPSGLSPTLLPVSSEM